MGMGIGPGEMMVFMIIALLLFGRNLPSVAKSLGKTVSEFKKGMSGFNEEFRSATKDISETANSVTDSINTAGTSKKKTKQSDEDTNTASAPKFALDEADDEQQA